MTRFTALDAVVLVLYLAGTTALGLYVGRTQRDSNDYFVADRAIPWWAVMFSIVASETSALTFISTPGVAYGAAPGVGNLTFLQIVVGYLFGRIVVAYTLLPRYYQGELVTAYALLETRFGLATRRFTSIVFMVTRALADSVRVFATAIPVALIISPNVTNKAYVMPMAVLILGFLTVIYTYKGGMKAVVWTELLQAGIYISGGIGGAFLAMASHGTDQLIVQRLMSSRSLRDAQRAIIGSGFVVFCQFFLFLCIGLGLWAFYQGRIFPSTDQIFPMFIL